MPLILHADQLHRNPHPLAVAAHAALQHVISAQFPTDLADIFGGVLVRHGRGSRDYT
jgi:hypothetical protein